MKSLRTCIWLPGLAMALVLAGCVQHIHMYPGPRLPRSQVAKLTGHHFQLYHMTTLYVDGRQLVPDPNGGWIGTAKVLPGPHEIEWSYKARTATFTHRGSGTLDAEAGKTYCFRFEYLPKSRVLTDLDIYRGGETRTYRVSVADYATWIEERNFWGQAKVVVGAKPTWAK